MKNFNQVSSFLYRNYPKVLPLYVQTYWTIQEITECPSVQKNIQERNESYSTWACVTVVVVVRYGVHIINNIFYLSLSINLAIWQASSL